MSRYLILYRSEMSPAEQFASATPDQQQAFAQAWTAWDKSAGTALVDPGNPTQAIDDPKAGGDYIGGYAIIEADAPDQVNKLLVGHPHIAAGGTVGVYQVADMQAP